jgi:hypothetical protein
MIGGRRVLEMFYIELQTTRLHQSAPRRLSVKTQLQYARLLSVVAFLRLSLCRSVSPSSHW